MSFEIHHYCFEIILNFFPPDNLINKCGYDSPSQVPST